MNVRILTLKTDKLEAFLRPGFILFHLMIVDGKKNLKSCSLYLEGECLVCF